MAGTDEQAIKLAIEARNNAASVIGEATRDVEKYRLAIKQLKAEGDSSAEGHRRLGDAILKYNEAQKRAQEAIKGSIRDTDALKSSQEVLKKAVAATGEALSDQAGAFGRFASSLGGSALAIGAVAGAATALIGAALGASKAIGDFQEHQDLLADQLGLTQREIGGLTLGAANVGRSFDAIQPALFIFTRRLGEARSGSEDAVKAFKSLGIDAQRDMRSTSEVLQDVASRLDTVGSAAERNAALVGLFGRGGAQVLPVLRQDLKALADEAVQQGIVLSESQQKTAREADQAWDKLKASLAGLRNSFLITLAPLGTDIANAINGAIRSMRGLGAAAEETDLSRAVSEIDRLHKAATDAKPSVDGLTNALKGLAPGREGGPLGVGGLIVGTLGITGQARQTSAAGGLGIPGVGDIKAITQEHAKQLDTEKQVTAEKQKQLDIEKFPSSGGDLVDFPKPPFGFNATKTPFRPTTELIQAPQLQQPVVEFTQAEKALLEITNGVKSLGASFKSNLASGLANAIVSAKNLGDVLHNVLHQAAQDALEIAIHAGLTAILPFQSGGVLLQSGGYFGPRPVLAQSGLVVSGTRGVDSQRALIGRGEAVLSHGLTDFFTRVLGRLDTALTKTSDSGSAGAGNVVSFGPDSVRVEIRAFNGSISDLRRILNESLIPELGRSLRLGTVA